MKKKYTIWIIIGLSVIFVSILLVCADTLNARLSLAFTSIASLATVATLLIAIRLYDKFGLKQHLILKRAEKIFELLDVLLDYTFLATTGRSGTLMIRANLKQLNGFIHFPNYDEISSKFVFVSFPDYEVFFERIQDIRTSYWLPEQIQEKMDFFILIGFGGVEFDPAIHAKLTFGESIKEEKNYILVKPDMTVGNYVDNLTGVVKEIDNWLKAHSDVDIKIAPRY